METWCSFVPSGRLQSFQLCGSLGSLWVLAFRIIIVMKVDRYLMWWERQKMCARKENKKVHHSYEAQRYNQLWQHIQFFTASYSPFPRLQPLCTCLLAGKCSFILLFCLIYVGDRQRCQTSILMCFRLPSDGVLPSDGLPSDGLLSDGLKPSLCYGCRLMLKGLVSALSLPCRVL